MKEHTTFMLTDGRLSLPKELVARLNLKKGTLVVLYENEYSFEVFKAEVKPIRGDNKN